MSFNVSFPAGGVIDEVKKVNFPDHLFPKFDKPFTKGFRMEIPPINGVFQTTYTLPQEMEFIDVAIACSGYTDGDYWEMIVDGQKTIETMYTKEIAQHINAGTQLYIVNKLPAGVDIVLQYNNDSGTSKTVWFDLRFLK